MAKPPKVITLKDFEGYTLKTVVAGGNEKSLTLTVDPVAGTTTYEVKNLRGDWGNWTGTDFKEAITAYNEI